MDCISKDRKKIGTKEEVLEYEAKVEAEQAEKAKLAEEKQTRQSEINEDYRNLMKKIQKYNEDYKSAIKLTCDFPIFNGFGLLNLLESLI